MCLCVYVIGFIDGTDFSEILGRDSADVLSLSDYSNSDLDQISRSQIRKHVDNSIRTRWFSHIENPVPSKPLDGNDVIPDLF